MLESRYQGTILGLAIGDALGCPTDFLRLSEMYARYGPIDGGYAAKLQQVPTVLGLPPAEAMRILGEAWVGDEAVADVLYCFLRSPDDYPHGPDGGELKR